MNQTIRHLEYLVARHECVIVPGLGAVLSQNVHARELDSEGRWVAPSRSYSFNGALVVSDGLLAGSVARALRMSHERAAALVADEVAAMKAQLEREKSLTLGRVGSLHCDESGNIVFEAAERDTLAPFAGWYPTVETLSAASLAVDDQPTPKVVRMTAFGRFLRIAAAAIVLVAVGLALSTPVSVEDAQYASLGLPEIRMPQKKLVTPSVNEPLPENGWTKESTPAALDENEYPGSFVAPEQDHQPVVADKTAPVRQTPKTSSVIRLNDFDEYCLVIASLDSPERADMFILQESRLNPGLPMGILEQHGHYRVYAATGKTEAQALAAARATQFSRYKGVWVTRR